MADRERRGAPGRVLLHVCCGPCAVFPVEALRGEGFEVYGFWHNPNIHPLREYLQRRDSCRNMAAQMEVPLTEDGGYGLERFLEATFPGRAGPTERCAVCYRLRLGRTAEVAREAGFACYTTTLLVSPYQQGDLVAAIGEQEGRAHGVRFLYRDFRQGFREGRQKSREMGLYQQQYCGCIFSEAERYRRYAGDGAGGHRRNSRKTSDGSDRGGAR